MTIFFGDNLSPKNLLAAFFVTWVILNLTKKKFRGKLMSFTLPKDVMIIVSAFAK